MNAILALCLALFPTIGNGCDSQLTNGQLESAYFDVVNSPVYSFPDDPGFMPQSLRIGNSHDTLVFW